MLQRSTGVDLVSPPALWGWLPVIGVCLAWLIDFCINVLIGLFSIRRRGDRQPSRIYSEDTFLTGSLLIPPDFYPAWLRQISLYLPFAYTIYGPARLFVEPSLQGFLRLAAGQLAWISVLGITVLLVNRKGMRWLAINGG
jgi:ABC-2 type transport system permease protein